MRAIRSQGDGLQPAYSTATRFINDGPDMTRQEFKQEADINNILKRFGVGALQRQGIYGTEVDYNLDLQQAITATREAQDAYTRLPTALKNRYSTLDDFIAGYNAGHIKPADLKTATPPAPIVDPSPEDSPELQEHDRAAGTK